MFRRSAITLLAALAASLGVAQGSSACTCLDLPTLQQSFDSAIAVFSGRVTSIQPAGDDLHVLVTVVPRYRWKGNLDEAVLVATGQNAGLCGVGFQIDTEYLIFAWTTTIAGRERPFTHVCSRTAPAQDNPDVTALGPPLVPTAVRAISWGGVKRIWH